MLKSRKQKTAFKKLTGKNKNKAVKKVPKPNSSEQDLQKLVFSDSKEEKEKIPYTKIKKMKNWKTTQSKTDHESADIVEDTITNAQFESTADDHSTVAHINERTPSNNQKRRKRGISPSKNSILERKNLHKYKRKTVADLHELQQILGSSTCPDEKEEDLQHFIFGCNSDDLERDEESSNEQATDIEEKKKPAWVDDDDENILVKEKADTLRRCHKSVYVRGNEKYSDFVQEKFKKLMGSPKWAELKGSKADSSEEESDDELLRKTGNFIQHSKSLPKGIINIHKCPSLVDENFKGNIIKSVEFHPSSKVALMAGTNCTVHLFQIDGKINAKIQSVHFERFPIHTAHFTTDGKEIIVGSNMHGHFFTYDMIVGKINRVPWEKGMEQRNIRRFHISPDGKYIVIHGRYGNIHLVTVKSKEWIGSMKMNGEVIATTFNKDGSRMYSHGSTGEIYVWDMSTRTCIHKFVDEGCITGTSLALSPNGQFLAAGSDAGVVNIYDNNSLFSSSSLSPHPLKTLMNLTTEVTQMKFNCSSELLAMASSHKPDAVKLVHFPSMSVFSNFPVREARNSLKYINSVDFSVNSGYFCVGNNLACAHVFRLKHYHNY